ncbi:MAG: 16S rRNA (cytosine(1402)-N(4))-methyltransferase RsmH [Bacteroidales bacterium]
MYHTPVMLKESIEGLAIKPDGVYVDATYGGGGHAREILNNLTTGRLIAFDQDEDALRNKPDDERCTLIHQNFRYMKNFLRLYKAMPVDGILADLGISSHQIDVPARGFSIRYDTELDLRMDQKKSLSAKYILNTYSFERIREIFSLYGELNNAGAIASLIVKGRQDQEIITVNQFRNLLTSCTPRGKENQFFARIFQALRIEVNDELEVLKELLRQSNELLIPGGRLVVIAYHSLEDRLVKNFMKTGNFEGNLEKDFYGNVIQPLFPLTRKPVEPSDEEIEKNNRSRSAKLRIAEKR